MALFGRKKEEDYEDEERDFEKTPRKIRDLKPENKKKRKEPVKPWGKKERYIVLSILLGTVLVSGVLALTARDLKLPGLPRLSPFSLNFSNPFREEVINVGKIKDMNKVRSEEIISEFKSKTDKLSGVYALYVVDLDNNYSFGVNENEVMQAASLIKLPVMLYVDGKVDDSKLEAMGKRSDNAVFSEMVKKFGKDTLQDYIDTLGMARTSIEENETTPKEIGDLFKGIYDDQNGKILTYLTDTIFEDWLAKGVPSDVRISHKFGREVHVVNDAGIVFATRPYVVVIMTQGIVESEANSIFPELSRLVYDGMTK